MEVEIVVNGGVTLVLIPKNDMEEQLLKELANQPNDIAYTIDGIQIVGKQVSQGLIITKATGKTAVDDNNQESDTTESSSEDADKEEDL